LIFCVIDDLATEYRFVAPDCVTWRGLQVLRRPMSAMCGQRRPFETFDTTTTESELLRNARSQPSFGPF